MKFSPEKKNIYILYIYKKKEREEKNNNYTKNETKYSS